MRVRAAMEQLTYQPNNGARALRGRHTRVVALALHLWEYTDVADVLPYIQAITASARDRDYDLVLLDPDEGPSGFSRLVSRRICDGIVMMDVRYDDDRLETVAASGLPVVLVGTPGDRHGLAAVDFDARRAAELAVDELADTGHRHVVVVGEPPEIKELNFHYIREFLEGAENRAHTRHLNLEVVSPRLRGLEGIASIHEQLFANRSDRLGLIARNPQVISNISEVALAQNLLLGRDLSLVGLCTDQEAMSFRVPISNVSPEPRDMSRVAMSVLFSQIDGDAQATGQRMVSPRAVTRRASTVSFA